MAVITPLVGLDMLANMKRDLPLYLAAAASAPIFKKESINDYTQGLLKWWREHGTRFPAWRLASKVAFALTPNSASCERVFALMNRMFDEECSCRLSRTPSNLR